MTGGVETEEAGRRPERPSTGRVALGVLLLVMGGAWLIDVLGYSLRWEIILPTVLIAIGGAIVVDARRSAHGGLIALGIVLTVLLALGTTFVPVLGSIGSPSAGEVTERVTAASELQPTYELGVGSLTVDLSRLEVAGIEEVQMSVGVGELTVLVPREATVEVQAEVGIGQVEAFDMRRAGMGVELSHSDPGDSGTLMLQLSVGIGEIEVSR